ncbi:hypothetical protein [Methylobacterium gnaphalii]|nr:hypothetical protein [Methylobacterium gnaphalii]
MTRKRNGPAIRAAAAPAAVTASGTSTVLSICAPAMTASPQFTIASVAAA